MKKLLIALVLVTLLVGDLTPALAVASPPAAEAQFIPLPILNIFVGVIRSVSAINRRNRVYNEAKVTVEDLNAYYDNLIDHMSSTEMGGQNSRTRWQIEAERQAVIQAAEYFKRGAHHQFGNEMGQNGLDFLAGSGGGIKFVGRIRQTIKTAHAAAIQIQATAAVAQEVPVLMVETLNEQLGWFALPGNAVKQLGGGLGQFLNNALGGIPDRVEAGSAQLEADMETTVNMLVEMDGVLDSVLQGGRLPISAATMAGGNIRGSGAGLLATVNHTIDNFLGLFSVLDAAGKPPPFMTNIRENIRIQLLAGHLQTLDAAAYGASFADCEIVDRAGYLAAAGQLGMTPEIALDEERVIYKICRHRDSGEIFYAFMIGPNAPREETDPVEEGEVGGDELYGAATPTPTAAAPSPEATSDAPVVVEITDVTLGVSAKGFDHYAMGSTAAIGGSDPYFFINPNACGMKIEVRTMPTAALPGATALEGLQVVYQQNYIEQNSSSVVWTLTQEPFELEVDGEPAARLEVERVRNERMSLYQITVVRGQTRSAIIWGQIGESCAARPASLASFYETIDSVRLHDPAPVCYVGFKPGTDPAEYGVRCDSEVTGQRGQGALADSGFTQIEIGPVIWDECAEFMRAHDQEFWNR
jgi:hypothetical protein